MNDINKIMKELYKSEMDQLKSDGLILQRIKNSMSTVTITRRKKVKWWFKRQPRNFRTWLIKKLDREGYYT